MRIAQARLHTKHKPTSSIDDLQQQTQSATRGGAHNGVHAVSDLRRTHRIIVSIWEKRMNRNAVSSVNREIGSVFWCVRNGRTDGRSYHMMDDSDLRSNHTTYIVHSCAQINSGPTGGYLCLFRAQRATYVLMYAAVPVRRTQRRGEF